MNVNDGVRFILPGRWWVLNTTGTQTQLVTTIKNHVERVVGREDSRATIRRDLRTQLLEAAQAARSLGASRLYMGQQLAEGVPFPCTLVVVPVGERQRLVGSMEDRAQALAAVLTSEQPPVVVDSVEYPLVRVTQVGSDASPPEGTTKIEPGLRVKYWLASPYTGDLMAFYFTCSFAFLAEAATVLFDAVMGTISFPEPSEGERDELAAANT